MHYYHQYQSVLYSCKYLLLRNHKTKNKLDKKKITSFNSNGSGDNFFSNFFYKSKAIQKTMQKYLNNKL